jgi:hypothetical protein
MAKDQWRCLIKAKNMKDILSKVNFMDFAYMLIVKGVRVNAIFSREEC